MERGSNGCGRAGGARGFRGSAGTVGGSFGGWQLRAALSAASPTALAGPALSGGWFSERVSLYIEALVLKSSSQSAFHCIRLFFSLFKKKNKDLAWLLIITEIHRERAW